MNNYFLSSANAEYHVRSHDHDIFETQSNETFIRLVKDLIKL
jgi:hypothetical protein